MIEISKSCCAGPVTLPMPPLPNAVATPSAPMTGGGCKTRGIKVIIQPAIYLTQCVTRSALVQPETCALSWSAPMMPNALSSLLCKMVSLWPL